MSMARTTPAQNPRGLAKMTFRSAISVRQLAFKTTISRLTVQSDVIAFAVEGHFQEEGLCDITSCRA